MQSLYLGGFATFAALAVGAVFLLEQPDNAPVVADGMTVAATKADNKTNWLSFKSKSNEDPGDTDVDASLIDTALYTPDASIGWTKSQSPNNISILAEKSGLAVKPAVMLVRTRLKLLETEDRLGIEVTYTQGDKAIELWIYYIDPSVSTPDQYSLQQDVAQSMAELLSFESDDGIVPVPRLEMAKSSAVYEGLDTYAGVYGDEILVVAVSNASVSEVNSVLGGFDTNALDQRLVAASQPPTMAAVNANAQTLNGQTATPQPEALPTVKKGTCRIDGARKICSFN